MSTPCLSAHGRRPPVCTRVCPLLPFSAPSREPHPAAPRQPGRVPGPESMGLWPPSAGPTALCGSSPRPRVSLCSAPRCPGGLHAPALRPCTPRCRPTACRGLLSGAWPRSRLSRGARQRPHLCGGCCPPCTFRGWTSAVGLRTLGTNQLRRPGPGERAEGEAATETTGQAIRTPGGGDLRCGEQTLSQQTSLVPVQGERKGAGRYLYKSRGGRSPEADVRTETGRGEGASA